MEFMKIMKKGLFSILVLFASSFMFAQSAKFIDDTLNTAKVTLGQVCFLSANTLELINATSSETDAYNALYEHGIVHKGNIDDPVNFAQVSSIFAKTWNVKGGLFMRLTNRSPRYSYKFFKAYNLLPSYVDPQTIPNGVQLLNFYTRCDDLYGVKNDSSGENE